MKRDELHSQLVNVKVIYPLETCNGLDSYTDAVDTGMIAAFAKSCPLIQQKPLHLKSPWRNDVEKLKSKAIKGWN